MIKWDKYFDAIYCLNFQDGSQERKVILEQCKRRLYEVGLLFHPIFEFYNAAPSVYSKIAHKHISQYLNCTYTETPDFHLYDVTITHYNAIKYYYSIGCEHILVLENDIAFLKDQDKITEYLDNLPQYDICNFDYVECYGTEDYTVVNDYYKKFNYAFRASMIGLSRNGMKYIIDNLERQFLVIDCVTADIKDHELNFGTGVKLYHSYSDVDPIRIKPNLRLGIQLPSYEYNDAILRIQAQITDWDVNLYKF